MKLPERLMTQAQVAEWLQVPKKEIYRWIEDGLPHVRISARRLRFDPDAVSEWIEARWGESEPR